MVIFLSSNHQLPELLSPWQWFLLSRVAFYQSHGRSIKKFNFWIDFPIQEFWMSTSIAGLGNSASAATPQRIEPGTCFSPLSLSHNVAAATSQKIEAGTCFSSFAVSHSLNPSFTFSLAGCSGSSLHV